MDKTEWTPPLCDEYGNHHALADELARGGQGVVFRTKDADLAIKQPLNPQGEPDTNINLRHRFQNIRLLPLPPRIPLSLPLAILRDQPGYVMRLLNDMTPFTVFDLDGKTKKDLEEQQFTLPGWLAGVPDKDLALRLIHYARTGSTRRRLFALSECAAILARLHCSGMVYGDISSNNAFIGAQSNDVWLIDADNLRFEMASGGISGLYPGLRRAGSGAGHRYLAPTLGLLVICGHGLQDSCTLSSVHRQDSTGTRGRRQRLGLRARRRWPSR